MVKIHLHSWKFGLSYAPGWRRDYMQRMQSAARMQTLIQDLLLYSRVTMRAQPFVLLDLHGLVVAVLVDLEAQLERVNGRVLLEPLPKIYGDNTQIRQLFQNLISNALKFHRPATPPAVQVSGAEVELNGRRWCQILVQDNGIGFEPQYADRIFEMFQRLHGRSDYEGSGVGLAISRKIV